MWLWTPAHLQKANDADGAKLYQSSRQGVTFPLADALCWLLASRCQILDVLELEAKAPRIPPWPKGSQALLQFFTDLCHVQAARAAGEVGRICAELVFGYNRHPAWDAEGCAPATRPTNSKAWKPDPGHRQPGARYTDVIEDDGSHPPRPVLRALRRPDSSPACACAWMAASPARNSPKIAPPKPSPR